MVPMRLVPFKVICLLGMNDGEFPRRDPPGGLNRLAAQLHGPQRQIGDRSIREDDRGLFLQLLAAATDVFYVSYLGQDPRSGEARPPSVVVSELLDCASNYFHDAGEVANAMTVRHPLQPFSPAALGGDGGEGADARRFTYHAGWGAAAALPPAARAVAAAFARGLPADSGEPTREWTRAELVRALANPSREFLSARLGLRLPENNPRLPEEEPFDASDGLDRHQLDTRVFEACLEDRLAGPRLLAPRLLAEGRIAPGAAGQAALRESLRRLAPALQAWRFADGGPARKRAYSLDIGDWRLDGVLERIHDEGLRQFSASKGHGKTLLALGIDALVWSALGETRPIQRVMIENGLRTLQPLSPDWARNKLAVLLGVAERARREPLPFMPRSGHAWVHAEDETKAQRAALSQWQGKHGESTDLWLKLALRGAMPFGREPAATAEFGALSRAIFEGLPGADVDIRLHEVSDD
jgi:exodeoxyribonuclease V gamma subunit